MRPAQQRFRLRITPGLAAGDQQAYPVTQRVGAGVDFSAHPAPAAAQTLGRGIAFLAGGVLVSSHHGRIEHYPVQIGHFQRLEHGRPRAFFARRRKRRHTELHLPKRSGRSAHGAPVRNTHTTVLKNKRSSAAVTSQFVALPGSNGTMMVHY